MAGFALLALVACSPREVAPAGGSAPLPAGSTLAPQAQGETGTASSGGQSAAAATGQSGAATQAAGQASQGGGGSAAQEAAAAPTGAYISFVTGIVSSTPAALSGGAQASGSSSSTGASKRVRVADAISPGELLSSGKASAAEVRIGTDFDIGIGEETSVLFETTGSEKSANAPLRLRLRLQKGSLQIKAGSGIIAGALAQSGPAQGAPLLLEIQTPALFVSSRGGDLLVTAIGDANRTAVGLGQAWVLPQSVVYSDLVDNILDPKVLDLLDAILSQAVPVSRHQLLDVTDTQLANINKVGVALRSAVSSHTKEKQVPDSALKTIEALAKRAASDIQPALGRPEPLPKALQEELDPGSLPRQQMKTTSDTTGTSGNPAGATGSATSTTAPSAGAGAASTTLSRSAPAGSKTALNPTGSTRTAAHGGTTATGAPAGSAETSAASTSTTSASSGASTTSTSTTNASGALGSAVLDALNSLFGGGSSSPTSGSTGTAAQSSSTSSTTGGTSSSSTGTNGGSPSNAGGATTGPDGFPGPTPPTPPTPPTVP